MQDSFSGSIFNLTQLHPCTNQNLDKMKYKKCSMNTFALTINKQLLIAQLVFIHKDIRIFKQKYLQFEILSDTHVKDPIKSKKQINSVPRSKENKFVFIWSIEQFSSPCPPPRSTRNFFFKREKIWNLKNIG